MVDWTKASDLEVDVRMARIEGVKIREPWTKTGKVHLYSSGKLYSPSNMWSQAGPLQVKFMVDIAYLWDPTNKIGFGEAAELVKATCWRLSPKSATLPKEQACKAICIAICMAHEEE